jgi:hypothetical protein
MFEHPIRNEFEERVSDRALGFGMLRQTLAASSGVTGFIALIAAASISDDPPDHCPAGCDGVRSLVDPFAHHRSAAM